VNIFAEIVDGLRSAGCDAILNLSTGGAVAGIPLEERLKIIPELKPEIASFSVGSGCLLGRYDYEQKEWLRDRYVPLFPTYKEMETTAEFFRENGTKPELEIYHAGMINNLKTLDKIGVFKHPMLINLVMGIPGEVSPAEVRDLIFLVDSLPDNVNWHVTGIGGKNHFRITLAAVLLDGHLRVGMEDNLYVERGVLAENNAQLVEKAVRLLNELGESPASPAEARTILGL
ncbi:MAG: 3-keto-5-aminohexanoate cleavage protein, partial [Deltaproteobacteria bacterium]|nr:3-keto-5-aminohexanoate cleavage protein [Deltaproteobacteria bacterium]